MSMFDQWLASEGRSRADVPLRGDLGSFVRDAGVPHDASLDRVLAIPRRQPATEQEIDQLSAYLRKRPYNTNGEPNRLRPAQVEALRELYECRGLFGPMRVGSGKTLVTLLAATLLGSGRQVLVVPAKLRVKTRREFAAYFDDWHVRLPTILSYEELGRPDREHKLLEAAPDLLLLDEAHKARNLDSAVTRRIKRTIDALHPVVAVLSGTLITDKLMEYHHQALWALGEGAPIPLQRSDAELWSNAVDKDVTTLRRFSAGALEAIPGGFHQWLRGSRGVVPTPGDDCKATIQMSLWCPETPEPLRKVTQRVADTAMRPDGEPLDEWEVATCLSQLALGFYYVWDPMPPDYWLRPRRGWRMYTQAVLDEHLDGFDSKAQITNALDRPDRLQPPEADEGRELLAAWRAVKHTFEPNPVAVWWDPATSAWTRPGVDPVAPPPILAQAVRDAGPACLIWTRFSAPGEQLSRLGVPYYGGGTDPESAPPGQTIALSINAHGEGRNMQFGWHRALLLTLPADPDGLEQVIGREHRQGQKSPTVAIRVINTIDYHTRTLSKVLTEAAATSAANGFPQKLIQASWT